jgi:transcriptional regulator with XRE-family HTH domain
MKNDYILKISNLLKQKNISQSELARRIDKTANTVSNYFISKTKIDVDTLLKIAEVLDVSVCVFFEENNTLKVPEHTQKILDIFKKLSIYDSSTINNILLGRQKGYNEDDEGSKMAFLQFFPFLDRYEVISKQDVNLLIEEGYLSSKASEFYQIIIDQKEIRLR